MTATYLELIILYCLKKINGERTIYSIYHLLKGKKSSQTIQDTHLFQLHPFFQAFPSITRIEIEEKVGKFERDGWIEKMNDQYFFLTEKGRDMLDEEFRRKPVPEFLNGWKYHNVTELFWERLSLFIQVCSNLINRKPDFVPVHKKKETLVWLKNFLAKQEKDRFHLSEQLYKELTDCFEANHQIDPAILVIRFTGYNRIGLTENQAAEKLGMEQTYYRVSFLNLLHYMIETITKRPARFPLLHFIIPEAGKFVPLTNSAKKTYELLNSGMPMEKIARVRNLKKSTIEDHIVEIALNMKDFDISPYVDQSTQKNILEASGKVSSKQLKHIRAHVENASYFEIRLVLAKYGDQQ
ncbi:RQC domain-containing protein [Bacillus methanolicus]|uniref:helix-turn-helix domain-containing protein n=1 Tax=Bacillus methanolicus TaxID=1471 RepID=UPI002380C3EB|nr:helix-turn-helix domain-containing protein [Bacillus methanolicus]MDE3839437.1 RQC domain-containing protein [Bacillus methanolicus]